MAISRPLHRPGCVQRSLIYARAQKCNAEQVRCLWWWGRQGKSWWSSQNEDIEERMRRHQMIMMQRYSRALRRRSMWDREDSPPPWSWKVPAKMRQRVDRKEMSSTESLRAKVEERDVPGRESKRPWEDFNKEFETFKAEVDKAIEKDPYGTLFGRRLRSPISDNNSSWTSWSWVFDGKNVVETKESSENMPKNEDEPMTRPKFSQDPTPPPPISPQELQQEKKSDPKPVQQAATPSNGVKTVHKYSSTRTETIMLPNMQTRQVSIPFTGEYIYDPISGRKVLQEKPSTTKSAATASKSDKAAPTEDQSWPSSFLRSMFAEHGAPAPTKIIEPKVYGYGEIKTPTSDAKAAATEPQKKDKAFENSKKREYSLLRMNTIGNSIDGCNFDDRWSDSRKKHESVDATAEEPQLKRVRSSTAPDDSTPLFAGTTYSARNTETGEVKQNAASDWLVREGFQRKAPLNIPSLQNDGPVVKSSNEPVEKLEPALNRSTSRGIAIPVKKFGEKLQPAIDRVAANRTSQESDASKKPNASALDRDMDLPVEKRDDVDILRASDVRAAVRTARVTRQATEEKKQEARKVLEQDYKHRQDAEQQIVGIGEKAAPMSASSESLTENFATVWKHIKQYPMGIVARTMQTIGITPEPETSSTKKAHSTAPSKPFAPPANDNEWKQLRTLGKDLKQAYESEQGSIDMMAQKHQKPEDKKAIWEPTVRPGVVRDLAMEKHTTEFEPKFAEIKDRAKAVKRELHNVHLAIADVVQERAIAALASRDLINVQHKPQAIEARKEALNAVLAPVEKAAAKIANEESARSASIDFKSPYILLSYNKSNGEVDATALNNLLGGSQASSMKTNPMTAIGSLKNPGVFVKHFVDLDKNSYEIVNGGEETLLFKKINVPVAGASKISPPELDDDTFAELSLASLTEKNQLRNKIAAAEMAAQPNNKPIKSGKNDVAQTAQVLDQIPTTIPMPGPSAPTAPTPTARKPLTPPRIENSSANPRPIPGSRPPRMKRQEDVFSGQVKQNPIEPHPFPPAAQAIRPDPRAHFPVRPSIKDESNKSSASSDEPQPGIFSRVGRTIRRMVLTAIAMGTGAYTIGVVAEGLGAQAQQNNIKEAGPRKMIVLPSEGAVRQRPGIYSTENSR